MLDQGEVMTRAEMRTVVKDLITHTNDGINTTVDTLLNTAIEAITQNVSAIYDEDIWYYTFTSGDVSANNNNWAIPSNTKYIRSASYIDVGGTEKTYKELRIVSPDQLYDYDSVDDAPGRGFVNMPQTDFSGNIRFGIFNEYSHGSGRSRVDAEGEPRICYRLQNSIFIHPRPSTTEVGNDLELFLHKYCAPLESDGASNTISINYPHTCIHYAVGLIWATKLNNMNRAQISLNLAGSMLQNVATAQEISKLVNINMVIGGKNG